MRFVFGLPESFNFGFLFDNLFWMNIALPLLKICLFLYGIEDYNSHINRRNIGEGVAFIELLPAGVAI
jgi:hypothetical protein